jgi:hypothetical protein
MVRLSRIALAATAAAVLGCQGVDSVVASATIYFALDAPLCSSVLPVQLSIDGAVVRTDTFRVNLSSPHTTSVGLKTSPGNHTLGARVVAGYVWPDTAVTVNAGGIVTKVLPFYCS